MINNLLRLLVSTCLIGDVNGLPSIESLFPSEETFFSPISTFTRQLREEDRTVRHSSSTAGLEIDVDASKTYNGKFMALMQSPCRPEIDGYFGATYGTPIEVKYGFQIESMPLAHVKDIVEAVDESLVDAILSSTFPQMCGFRRRRLGRVSGFRFLKIVETPTTCTPTVSNVNFCGVFQGAIQIFGNENVDAAYEILSLIDQVLNMEQPSRVHSELVRISSVSDMSLVVGGPSPYTVEKHGLSKLAKAIIALTIVLVVASVLWCIACRRGHSDVMSKGDTMSTDSDPTPGRRRRGGGQRKGFAGIFKTKKSKKKSKRSSMEPYDKSIAPLSHEEVNTMMLLTDGRHGLEVEFDQPSLGPIRTFSAGASASRTAFESTLADIEIV